MENPSANPNHRWLVEPAESESDGPRWWGVTIGTQAFAVKGSNKDDVINMLTQWLEVGRLDWFIIHPHEDRYQPELDERYPDGGVIKVVPFSMVEFPDDPDHITDEQRQALDALERGQSET